MITLKQYLSNLKEFVSSGGEAIRGAGYVTGNPDGKDTVTYVGGNIVNADTRNNSIFQQSKDHQELHNSPEKDPNKQLKQSKMNEELKVGEHDEMPKKKSSKSKTKMKRKYLGKTRGKTLTGQQAHKIAIDPVIADGSSPKAY